MTNSASLPTERLVAYLGPAGTHSHLTALGIFGPADMHGFCYLGVGSATSDGRTGLQEVLKAVAEGQAGWGVIPYYNTSSGPVKQVYASLLEAEHGIFSRLRVCGCISSQISHDLLGGGNKADVQVVYSKKEALEQCAATLKRLLPSAKAVEASSTAEAACRAEKELPHSAAIASRRVLPFHRGLRLLQPDFQDSRTNITRFLVVRKADADKTSGAPALRRHTWIEFTSSLESPVLQKILTLAERWGIPASALSGTVTKPETFEMRFLVELAAPIDSLRVQFLLSEAAYLPLSIVGSPVMAGLEDQDALREWLRSELAETSSDQEGQEIRLLSCLETSVRSALNQAGQFRLFRHPPVLNMESVWQVLGVPPARMVNTQACVADASKDVVFCCIRGDQRLDVSKVSEVLKTRCRRATRAEIGALGQTLGTMSAFTAPSRTRILWDRAVANGACLFMGSGHPGISVAWQCPSTDWPRDWFIGDISAGV